MPFGRMGRPGLLGMAARTAVVAGTATAVSGRVARRQNERAQAQQAEHEYEVQQEAAAMVAASPPPPQYAPPAASAPPTQPGGDSMVDQLQRLAELKNQGVLSEAEFESAKAKLLQ
ncbi:SHOCT domain-containing protein [Microbacterium kunmingense]|uniref:SHOCT domain-containing protein n=1 Tax=Microbacterium kunmingense TaxID=2915939 RepID=UPI003D736F6F